MYAIIETGGKQYRVSEGMNIKVERLGAEPGNTISLDRVLALVKEDKAVFGTPYLSGVTVNAEVVGEGKRDKILVFKQKARKGHRKLRGHRQIYTALRIKEIKEA